MHNKKDNLFHNRFVFVCYYSQIYKLNAYWTK